MRECRVERSTRDLGTARTIRENLALGIYRHSHQAYSLIGLARELEFGYKLFIKYSGGPNVSHAFVNEIEVEARRLNVDLNAIGKAIVEVVQFCVSKEGRDDKYPSWLEGVSLELSDLNRLPLPRARSIEDFIRFKSAQRMLGSRAKLVINF